MQELQSSTIFDNVRIVRGWSVIRLYGTQPVFQLLREWTLPDFAIFEFSSGLVDGKLKAILVGGSTSPQELCCNPNQPIEGSAELIEELAQLKGEVIFRNILESPDDDACPIALMFGAELKSLWIKNGVPFRCKSICVHLGASDSPLTVDKPMH